MNYHLLKANGEWRLQEKGSDKALFTAATKSEALDNLNEFMDEREGHVTIHRAGGEFQETRRYRHEPSEGLGRTAWSVIGVAAVAALTAAAVVYRFRGDLPIDRLRLPGRG